MKFAVFFLIFGLVFSVFGCENVSRDAVELSVDFSWEGMKPCGWGNPEIRVGGVPEKTKFLKISMFDHAYFHDHGSVTTPYSGNGNFARDAFKALQGPCPPWGPGRYEITVKAIDEQEGVIGVGSKERSFPEVE